MSFLFGSRQTPAEQLRKHQRALTKAIRDLDRERQKLEQQEKKVIAEIKKAARQGQNVFAQSAYLLNIQLAYTFPQVPLNIWWSLGCLQGDGKGSGADEEICAKVLSDAHTVAGCFAASPNVAVQPGNG